MWTKLPTVASHAGSACHLPWHLSGKKGHLRLMRKQSISFATSSDGSSNPSALLSASGLPDTHTHACVCVCGTPTESGGGVAHLGCLLLLGWDWETLSLGGCLLLGGRCKIPCHWQFFSPGVPNQFNFFYLFQTPPLVACVLHNFPGPR